jgi:hypothetical protein
MGELKSLFDKLADLDYCRYSENGKYPVEDGDNVIELTPKELLEVGKSYPAKEHIMIAYFGDEPTRVLYAGQNVISMKKTISDLRIPNSWPSNIGEKVFYLFRSHLEAIHSGSICLEQKVISGKEHQFGLVLKKLVALYRKSEEKAYAAALKSTLSGEITS